MEIITGSTWQERMDSCIHLAVKQNAYMVVYNHDVCHQAASRAMELGYPYGKLLFPITYMDFIEERYFARGIKAFVILDADFLLEHMARAVKLAGFSIGVM